MGQPKVGADIELAVEQIIRKHVGYAMVASMIPIPLVDLAAVTAVHIDMLKRLAKAYDVEFNAQSSKAFIVSAGSAIGGSAMARVGASLFKVVPVVGWVAGGIAQLLVTGAATYTIARLAANTFSKSQDLTDVNFDEMKDEISDYMKEGKEVAEQVHNETQKAREGQSADLTSILDALDHLERSAALRTDDENEFVKVRDKVLSSIHEKVGGLKTAEQIKIVTRCAFLAGAGVIDNADVKKIEDKVG